MGNELLATFYIYKKKYDVYGCWDKATPEGRFDFYDVYDEDGHCINEGIPLWKFPSWQELLEFIDHQAILDEMLDPNKYITGGLDE